MLSFLSAKHLSKLIFKLIKKKKIDRSKKFSLIYFLCFFLSFFFSIVAVNYLLEPISAQVLRPEAISSEIYQRMPDFPKENQYINRETGKVVPDNTLISRIVRYHQYVKSRPTQFRLDWKLTLADYLNLNEQILESTYPGSTTLQINPLPGDRQAISQLNRLQRNKLVDIFVNIYNPQTQTSPKPNSSSNTPNSTPTNPLPQPGDAELLK